MKIQKKILIFAIIAFIVRCGYFNTGTIRYATKKEKSKATYLMGFIENRDSYFDPYGAKNLGNMLKFEFINHGYDILQIEDILKSQEQNLIQGVGNYQSTPENKNPQAVTIADSPTATKIAGEKIVFNLEYEPKILREVEIKNLNGIVKFDYYIQGAVAMNDNRKLINKKESGIIFLEIYDRNGKITGSLNYTVDDRVFTEAGLLKDICSKIVRKIDSKEENEIWWKFWK
ncbi:lipoprotein [Leptospira yasudae]|uniref:Lipoprotein n=1 Tax=Leptospira yasudae TaxID=2202201 RepID=A0ABX9LZL9_9LEPT|nr:lipoprotein [Leptospira yasudae]RHX78454.1 lipoprotein [Leptospira yasudae]TGK31389.1 lipoprotein [Leptospira yasudae]TGM06694.1 lipoprotein [Leptospira yasudae]